MLSPGSAQALQSPFEDFKNHLGLLSIFVKQLNQKAAAHKIPREKMQQCREDVRKGGHKQKDIP